MRQLNRSARLKSRKWPAGTRMTARTTIKAIAAKPGKVSVACNMDNIATNSNKLLANAATDTAPNAM